jgi:UDP-N-acetylmuramoyl-tripeptide--D-alanyl-D-alanine ligase
MRLSLPEVLAATGGRSAGGSEDLTFTSFHTDSREVRPGGLFFALRGAALDGHAFCADAVGRGAAGVVVSRPVETTAAQLLVADTWRALYDLAGWVLSRVRPLVVGVTGSNGKTSTKEMTAAVLGTRQRVLRSQGNLNTETGVPLTLLRLEQDHTAAVLEMGLQRPGDIGRLAALARPAIGVVTMIGSVHLEFFSSREELARAKGELLQALPPDGLAVLPAQDPYLELLRGLSRAPAVTFGLESGDVRGSSYAPLADGGCEFSVEGVRVRLSLAGRHQARNALAALAVGRAAGVPLAEGAAALAGVRLEHRFQEVPGPKGCQIVDDTYNASPESMLAAFRTLAERPRRGRLLALLGEMRELGPEAADAHRWVGRSARQLFDRVAVLDAGEGRTLAAAAGAELVGGDEAACWIERHAGAGDLVLVKGSRALSLDRIVTELSKRATTEDTRPDGGLS